MKVPILGMRVYHDEYGLGTITGLFNEESSIVNFDNHKVKNGVYLKYNKELTEIDFESSDATFKYFCPICSKFTIYKGTLKNGLEWLKAMRGTLCPECDPKTEE